MNRPLISWILVGVIVVLSVALVGTLLFVRNQVPQSRGIPTLTAIEALEPDIARWGVNFPNQYSTLLLTKDNAIKTTYGGSDPYSKLEADPRLVTLFAGYPFSDEYNEERGHLNALDDVRATRRLRDNTPGTCYSCKSSDNPRLWSQMGMEQFDATLFSEMGQHIDNPIGCANCHEAETMKLVVTNPALDQALKTQGLDWRTFTRQQMRTVVCANCHVEYYFVGDKKYLTFPWANGTNIDQIAAYYTENGFVDWKYPEADIPMIKMQHPEYEMFTAGSTHYQAGVSCADCHMAYTRDGAAKFSTHDVKSPLLNAETACGACHTDVKYVTGRVAQIQKQVAETMAATEEALVASIAAIKLAAADPAADPAVLDEARQLHRLAQMRWDFVAAENSMGFHNPEEALRILAAAIDLARQAQLKALTAGAPAGN